MTNRRSCGGPLRVALQELHRLDPDETEYRYETRIVRVPKDAHRSKSQKASGAASDLLREDDTNKLLGPSVSYSPEDADRLGIRPSDPNTPSRPSGKTLSAGQEDVAQVLGEVLGEVLREVVVQFVVPAVSRRIGKLSHRVRSVIGRDDSQTGADISAVPLDESENLSQDLDTSAEDRKVKMSSAEYRERVLEALTADAYAAWQREQLSNAQIDDAEVPAELRSTLERVLEGGTFSLDYAERAAVMRFLEGPQAAAGAHALSKVDDDETPELPPG